MIRARMTESTGRLKCTIHSTRPSLKGVIRIGKGASAEYYDGETIVKPIPWDPQVLDTKNKLMPDDVTVLAIPYFETSNLSDGLTVYIGE